jgi:hypothetical protein
VRGARAKPWAEKRTWTRDLELRIFEFPMKTVAVLWGNCWSGNRWKQTEFCWMAAADEPPLLCCRRTRPTDAWAPLRPGLNVSESESESLCSCAWCRSGPIPAPSRLAAGRRSRGSGTRPNACRTAGAVAAASRSGRGSGLTRDTVVGARRHERGPTSDDQRRERGDLGRGVRSTARSGGSERAAAGSVRRSVGSERAPPSTGAADPSD